MGRIRQMIEVDGRQCWTLFDSGARNTYVIPGGGAITEHFETTAPDPHGARWRDRAGGHVRPFGSRNRRPADLHHAIVIDQIGTDEDGQAIEILFGALAMQQWGIRPLPDREALDLSHYPDEFVEF